MKFEAQNERCREAPLKLSASIFGQFDLTAIDGHKINIKNRRAHALLAMLCLAPGESLDRTHVSKLLWAGRFEAQARASLRQCLLELNRLLGSFDCEPLETSRSRIGLKSNCFETDLALLETALADQRYDDACKHLTLAGKNLLLEQIHFGDAFEAWLDSRRREIEDRLRTAIEDALSRLKESGDLDGHARLLGAWRIRTPEINVMSNRRQGKTRLAVLPFQSLSDPDDQGFLADGIVDELITTLGQVPKLLIAGRTSSFQFRSSDKSAGDIADALNVSHLLEGSVQRQDEQVRIGVRLIDGESGFEVWSYRYDGTLDDIFTMRDAVAREITSGLIQTLNLDNHSLPVRTLTKSREAYGLYLQGRALTLRAIGDGVLETAIGLLENALEIDPEFAECWTALAEAHVYKAVYTPCLDKLAEAERMADCASRAIGLAPEQGHARAMLGLYRWTQNDAVGALDLAFEAYRLEPENPAVTLRLGSFLLYCGRTEQALPFIEAAIDQDPVDGRSYGMLCVAYLNLGKIEAAMKAGQRMMDLGQPSLHLAAATAASGDHNLAVAQYQRTRLLMNTVIFPPAGSTPMPPDAMDAYWLLAAKGIHSGRPEDRQLYCQLLDMLHATLPDTCDPTIVWPAIWMGYADMVFKTLGTQITPPNMVGLMSLWADIDPIRQTRLHPDFMDFAARIGLVAAWEKYGWPDLLPAPTHSN